ncbi:MULTISPECIES: DUF4229 domain-containing protein [Nonomuraea]|uniref:DUF4229 domain-containing protein n=2 Tax=Nonomuraea TaxID=83681 RepID=A0ABW1C2X9_9ACTN|nr:MULTISPECIES: DUF4229 domain-containing protein [Nonomuraea]MDA0639218.1 DUF4229 domain-containing protein [Nonomuraea ferruginea]TXK35379.1 DUF4229 domain-containing protein [Nonomuraea sp. C10]
MHPVLVYTASRIGLFVIAFGVLWLTGLQHPLLLIGGAFLVSGFASFVLLSKQRDAVSARLSNKLDRPKPQDD